jgi:polysaccharide chain length determinant protein (PEP-CTERM system associated)
MQTLRVLLRREIVAAWRHRWAAVIFAWLICIGGWLVVFSIPNQYESSARLFVDVDAVLTPLLRGIAIDSGLAGQLDMLQRTLLSRPNIEKLISKTDLDLSVSGPADLESMVSQLENAIHIVPQTHNLFTITYRSTSPKLAFDVVQTILTIFVESKAGINRTEMDNARAFLQQQIASYEQQLRDAEKRRADFRSKYVDLLPNDANGISGLEQARTAVRQLQGELQDATASRDMMNQALQSTPPMIVTDPGTAGGGGGGGGAVANPRLQEAERNLAELRLKYTDQHPDVIAARRLVDEIRSGRMGADPTPTAAPRTPASSARSVPNPIYEQFKVKLVQEEANIASIQRRLADAVHERDRLEEIARSAPSLQADFTNLNRDYDVIRKNYEELLGRRESMRIGVAADADADKVKLQIIDPPVVPQIPVAPKRIVLVSAVLLAGLAGGIGLSLLLVQFDRSFHSIDDLRDLGLPVVGGISLLSAPSGRVRVASVFTFAVAMLLLGAVYAGIVSHVIRPSDFT